MTIKKYSLLVLLLLSLGQANAQFFRGIGFFVGGTSSRHRYVNTSSPDSIFSNKFITPSHKSAERLSYSGGLMAEFLPYDRVRWQTEIEYCNKGAVERPFLSPLTEERGDKVVNKLSYIQWNNYAKFFLNEGYRGAPYILIGGRIEYNLTRSLPIYSPVVGSLARIRVTPDVALGYEFVSFYKWKFFSEVHYNPDIYNKTVNNIKFNNRTWELRIGLIYRPQKALDNCNAPKIRGNYY